MAAQLDQRARIGPLTQSDGQRVGGVDHRAELAREGVRDSQRRDQFQRLDRLLHGGHGQAIAAADRLGGAQRQGDHVPGGDGLRLVSHGA